MWQLLLTQKDGLFSVVNYLKYVAAKVLFLIVAFKTHILQGSLATHLRCDEPSSDNFFLILTVRKI